METQHFPQPRSYYIRWPHPRNTGSTSCLKSYVTPHTAYPTS
jgi:hypothetical protein